MADLRTLLDSIDDREGIPECTGWRSDQSIYVYSSVRFAQMFLQAKDPEKAVDYLYAFANHASPSRVWREEQPVKETHSAEICGDMPHNWASVEFIRLVRNLLVLEDFSGVELFPGLPDEWLPTEGNSLILERTPTRFGKMTLILVPDGENGYSLTFIREEGNQKPEYIALNWKNSVAADGEELPSSGGRYFLPLEAGEIRLHLNNE